MNFMRTMRTSSSAYSSSPNSSKALAQLQLYFSVFVAPDFGIAAADAFASGIVPTAETQPKVEPLLRGPFSQNDQTIALAVMGRRTHAVQHVGLIGKNAGGVLFRIKDGIAQRNIPLFAVRGIAQVLRQKEAGTRSLSATFLHRLPVAPQGQHPVFARCKATLPAQLILILFPQDRFRLLTFPIHSLCAVSDAQRVLPVAARLVVQCQQQVKALCRSTYPIAACLMAVSIEVARSG